ncbi:MAG: hypothetical protein RJB68_2245 [Pseudomonadota bacterium]|jgi:hypothetical protein
MAYCWLDYSTLTFSQKMNKGGYLVFLCIVTKSLKQTNQCSALN